MLTHGKTINQQPILTTQGTLPIFFYQRNKNKVLGNQLNSQNTILNETKDLLSQQTAAIDGQHKVVTTAMDYSERFDPKKLEDLIK